MLNIRLCKQYTQKVNYVYASTSKHADGEIARFYDNNSKVMNGEKTICTILIGDFNAKVGK